MKGTVESSPDGFTASNDQHHHHHHRIVLKRKRSKRPRPSSPFIAVTATTTTTTSSSSATAVTGSFPSPVVSYDESTVTEEEEDMATCLILLAQGGEYISGSEKTKSHHAVEKSPMMVMIHEGERGYVYECKTCNRKFNSFQALGGHRASHKRPKTTPKLNQIVATTVKLPNLSTNHRNKLPLLVSSPKLHECSICGAEFSSGQALGGHMRRHRSLLTAGPITSIVPADEKCDAEQQQEGRKILPMDLNLPAPDDIDHRGDSKFQFMFTSPALVDCHF